MKCNKCDVEFVWDHENPPGYVCPSCGDTKNACALCEEPCSHEFCSSLCESQSDDAKEDFNDDGFDEPTNEEDCDGRQDQGRN
jgi:hypothetical protein